MHDKKKSDAGQLFSIQDLGYRYEHAGQPALKLSSLFFLEGECVALTGSNGSGKTTLLKLLNHLLPTQNLLPIEQIISFKGQPYTKKIARKETVYLHQHPYIFRGSVWHNIRAAAVMSDTAMHMEILKMLRLENKAFHEARFLSGGEMQRVALARTIATGKPVLLLDEPTSGADSASAEQIIMALSSLKNTRTIIFSTHSSRVAEKLADRILHLDKGKIL